MDRELQDKAWACLPKELRDEVRKEYVRTIAQPVRNISWKLFNHQIKIAMDEELLETLAHLYVDDVYNGDFRLQG